MGDAEPTSASSYAPVIVVGGSLVGLSTALFLSYWKVPVILLEKHPGSSPHPRAIGYTARTIELLDSVGASEALSQLGGILWSGGPPRRIVVESLAGKWQGEQAWTTKQDDSAAPKTSKSKSTDDFKPYSHVEGVAVAQDKIEPLLRSRALELGAELRYSHRVIHVAEDDTGVTVTAVDSRGEEYSLRGKYLVACDGGKSPIRESLGIQRHGIGHVRALRSILFKCPRIEEYLNHGYTQFQIETGDSEAFLTTYGDGRWMLAWQELESDADSPTSTPDEQSQKDRIRKAAGLDLSDEDITLITTGKWDIGGHIADRFSSGRIFLAGDSAHTLPPNRGGYGANTGIADAHNIAWKLAAVLSGQSSPALLKTYDAERRPVAQARHDQIFAREDHRRFVRDRDWARKNVDILDDVSMEFGQRYESDIIIASNPASDLPLAARPEEWRGQPGTRAPHVALKGEPDSTLKLFGKTWSVLTRDESWKAAVESASSRFGADVQFSVIGADLKEEEEGEFDRLYGFGSSGAVLVRPDGFIAWQSATKPHEIQKAFEAAFAQASYPATK